mgnify:CR=1 FL=1
MQKSLKDLDIDFYKLILLKIFLEKIIAIIAVRENVTYCPKSPSL